jgi:hypothetical protein
VDQGDGPGGSPTSRPGPISERAWRMAAGLTACVLAPICAYRWAVPVDGRSLGLLLEGLLQVTGPMMGAFLIILAWREYLRFARPCEGFRERRFIILTWRMCLRYFLAFLLVYLLVALAEAVPAVGAAAGGWPGAWPLGVAGLVVGALAGAASGWLLRLLMGPLVTAWYVAEPLAADAGREPGSS